MCSLTFMGYFFAWHDTKGFTCMISVSSYHRIFRKILPSFPFLSEETEGQLENDRASTHLS